MRTATVPHFTEKSVAKRSISIFHPESSIYPSLELRPRAQLWNRPGNRHTKSSDDDSIVSPVILAGGNSSGNDLHNPTDSATRMEYTKGYFWPPTDLTEPHADYFGLSALCRTPSLAALNFSAWDLGPSAVLQNSHDHQL